MPGLGDRLKQSRTRCRRCLLVLGLIPSLSSWLVVGEAHADAGDEPIQLDYIAPAECPARDRLVDQIRSYTPRWTLATSDSDARRFVLRITKPGARYAGRFDLHSASGSVSRQIQGEDCDDVVAGLAVAVALAIDPHALDAPAPQHHEEPASLPKTQEQPELPPDRRPPPSSPPPAVATAKSAKSVTFAAGARADAHGAVSGVLPTFVAFGEIAWRGPPQEDWLFVLRPVLRAGIRQSLSRTARAGESSADIGFRAVFVEACPTRLALPARFSFEGCLGSNVGQLSAEARNVPGASTQHRLWVDAGITLGARWQGHSHLFVELAVGLWYPILRDRIRIEPDGVVSRAPPLGGSAGVGGGWRF